ncbi:MAG: dihydrofolate reductase [Rikenellaceae bacterium]
MDSSPQKNILNTTDRSEKPWIVDRFDDTKIIRYEVPKFEQLPLDEKLLIYYLSEASKFGRDILFDQNFRYNLLIRRTLEAAKIHYKGERNSEQWLSFERYLKKVWFANGIHHHYSNDKFTPNFSSKFFDGVVRSLPLEVLPLDNMKGHDELLALITPIIFDPTLYASRLNMTNGVDVVAASANNYYRDVIAEEVESFYANQEDVNDPEPISYGLNSQLIKDQSGQIREHVWRVGSMYTEAIEKIIEWLAKASKVAAEPQKMTIDTLINFYRTGDLREYDNFNIQWVKNNTSNVDFVNGFTETYGDPFGRKASWEAIVNFRDQEACRRTSVISGNAQWFEDNSPIDPKFRKHKVKGVTAKVITVAQLGGDCYPATPIGINLPNADWIRKTHGSKSVTIDNITYAYKKAAEGNGFVEEFILRPEDRRRIKEYGKLGDDLHTDLHECLGHGSGQLNDGVTGAELKTYGATLEECRADLFGLYYIADPKLIELGIIPNLDVAKAQYCSYITNGLMTQLARIEFGKNVEQTHMRNRKLISEWCYQQGLKENVIGWEVHNGKRYVVVNDFDKLRTLFAQLLHEIQRIKSEGDYLAGKNLVETHAIKIDPELHRELLDRYASLNIEPYGGFINPDFELVEQGGNIIDVVISEPMSYEEQMLHYSTSYSPLPNIN